MTSISYNLGIPDGPHNPSADQPNMKVNNDNIDQFVAVDHIGFNSGMGETSGRHKQVTFDVNNVAAVPPPKPTLFTNLVNSLPQLFFYSGDAAHSSTQYVSAANGSTFALGGIIIKWGNFGFSSGSGVQAVSFPVAFQNNFFSLSLLPNTTTPAAGVGSVSFGGTGSLSSFTAYRSNTSGVVTFFYIAIGN